MPYDPTKRQLVGYHDAEPISRRYEMQVERFRKNLAKRQTSAEIQFRKAVASPLFFRCRVRYVAQRVFHISDLVAFIADFYFPNFHLAVELDGRQHTSVRGRARDQWRDALLANAGIGVLRIKNADLSDVIAVRRLVVDALLAQPNSTPNLKRFLQSHQHLLFE